MGFVIRTIVTAVALAIATWIVDGISVDGKNRWTDALTIILVAIIFGFVNAFIKPVIKFFGCFFYIITLGLISFVVNALLFMLVGWLAGLINLPFVVDGFWAGLWGAIIVTFVSWGINLAIPDPKPTA
jgi:putative membrane protein